MREVKLERGGGKLGIVWCEGEVRGELLSHPGRSTISYTVNVTLPRGDGKKAVGMRRARREALRRVRQSVHPDKQTPLNPNKLEDPSGTRL